MHDQFRLATDSRPKAIAIDGSPYFALPVRKNQIMQIHDWRRVEPGLFHHFHQDWSVEIARALNRGVLPPDYYALVEQRVDGPEPDVVAVETLTNGRRHSDIESGVATLVEVPHTRLIQTLASDAMRYAQRANRISVRHQLGEVVAVIEIVSPGNKASRSTFRAFVAKAVELLQGGVHLLIIDLFPPTARDPNGIHQAIWDEFQEAQPPLEKQPNLTLVSYCASLPLTAYIEPVDVGQSLPDMPLFLTAREHILVPLAATYHDTWTVTPKPIRDLVG